MRRMKWFKNAGRRRLDPQQRERFLEAGPEGGVGLIGRFPLLAAAAAERQPPLAPPIDPRSSRFQTATWQRCLDALADEPQRQAGARQHFSDEGARQPPGYRRSSSSAQ